MYILFNIRILRHVFTHFMMIFWIASISACDVLCLLLVYDTTYLDTSSISLISGQFGFEYYSRSLMSQFTLHPRSSVLLRCTTLTDFVLLILKCETPFLSINILDLVVRGRPGLGYLGYLRTTTNTPPRIMAEP